MFADRFVGDKSIYRRCSRNTHPIDRAGRMYFCRCAASVKIGCRVLRMRVSFGCKKNYRSKYKINYENSVHISKT